mmetsp:Transcript_5227/g.15510  ORF Transcript_5227/g.15510 Transcript_5227/m.15510 type:complete len:236 (-) Transcript_5227:45-752(-)|eukprot:CAMPEP_0119269508 /NCGR_PEP_ID=MMETSP1329-20130426/6888_1 /TAXON_ID=114041 /ORGANISM="Genus nov. species nov., Strain RCC1024" /LENGTH=235 /DNA_ID=CAMNT_0007269507 /DNA_START=100 /DNA_END=807 /DNA_ORIENTATION=+
MNQLLRLALAATLAPLVHPFLTPAPAAGRAHARPLSVLADAATSSITTISGNNLKMTDAMRAYVEAKVGGVIERYGGVAQRCDAHLSVMRNPSVTDSDVAEVVVFCKGEVVRAEERSPSMYSSIDLVADKVARKLRKVKERKEGKRSKPKLKVSLAEALEQDPAEEELAEPLDATTLVRRKKHPMPRQSLADAMICMDGLDHSFYMFTNEETGDINCIYKRNDGGIGLIEPDGEE